MIITLYGINNIGKSTQAQMLLERLSKTGSAKHIKFPIYDLNPTGPIINEYLRGGNPYEFSPREFQFLNIQNRLHFASTLNEMRSKHSVLILEDYTGTGIAWGIGAGVDKELLMALNSTLPEADINILLDGERFVEAKEDGHTHEEDTALINNVRQAHLDLAKELGWRVVDANDARENIHKKIWSIVRTKL